MKPIFKLALVCAPLAFIAACGGGDDLADRLDLANPTMRFVHASPLAPNVSLYRGTVVQTQADNVPYKYASNYYDIDMSAADWSVKTTTGSVTIGSVNIDPKRGNRYTIVALPASSTESSLYLINDPYNKALTSTSTHLRVMNASFNAASVDVYMTKTTDISAAAPQIAAVAYKTSGPKSTDDSFEIAGDTYKLTITTAGTKTVLFSGTLPFGNNQDVLVLTVPDAGSAGGIKALVKTGELALSEVGA
jgi:Domain of unknown function (DUF4397)